jgi:enoyl-CoA hydratase
MRRARASKMALPACLEQDWALVGHFVEGEGDYWEGVRARLIDKDERPDWSFKRVEDVPAAAVEALMALGAGRRRLGAGRGDGRL